MADVDKWLINKLDSSHWDDVKIPDQATFVSEGSVWICQKNVTRRCISTAASGIQQKITESLLHYGYVSKFITLITFFEEPGKAWTALKDHF